MKRSGRSQTLRAGKWQSIATGLVRPGAEAVLLAGVAFGCAQIGWRIVEPASAGVPGSPFPLDVAATETMAQFQSPFAPAMQATDAAVPSAVTSIRLVGVRMSQERGLSGAVLTFGDDLQRPFLVGQTIGEGIALNQVYSDHIVVAFGNAEQVIELERTNPAPRSFALALMGKSVESDAGPVIQQADAGQLAAAAQTVSLSETASSPANTQWLLSTMGSVESRNGAPYGWRVTSAPPAILAERGLASGDVIVSVNGARPGDAAAVMAAARSSRLELAIERASGERANIVLVNGLAS